VVALEDSCADVVLALEVVSGRGHESEGLDDEEEGWEVLGGGDEGFVVPVGGGEVGGCVSPEELEEASEEGLQPIPGRPRAQFVAVGVGDGLVGGGLPEELPDELKELGTGTMH
jgi:hypothetical protein